MFSMLFGGYGGYGFSGYGDYYEDFDHDPWSNRSEKSGAAERRESVVTNRFKSIRAIVKNTLEEKRKVCSAGCA
jgi:predicted HD phosphohydrolase